jgi:hypothetical protein
MSGSQCRTCGAAITWATSAMTGKNMPLDAEPTAEGTMLLKDGIVTPEVRATPAFLASRPTRHTSHFSRCPQADQWRKSR